jgi:hypothetical protein
VRRPARAALRGALLAVALGAPAAAEPPPESPRAFLVEQLLELARLDSLETREQLGAPLTGVRRDLQAAELVLAELDDAQSATREARSAAARALAQARVTQAQARFEALRTEIAAQMDYVDALLSRAELDQALVQAEAQLAQTQAVLTEAEARARAAEANTASPGSAPP